MKGISIAMQIECDCGSLLEIDQPLSNQLPMLKQAHYQCKECLTSYFLHIQEVKQTTCNMNVKTV